MPTREEQELETLKANSPYALPDDAAASGWTTAQKKEKFYAGLLYLYELFKASRSSTEGTVSEFTQKVDTFTNMVNAFIEADKASKDGDNNVISATYAKIANIANGTIPAVKYKKGENETENINAIEPRLMVLINKILGYFTGGKANNALSADKATSDGDGRSIKTTYATKTEAATIQTAINNVLNGASTVAKSLGDGNGNTISSTYETKSDATAKVARTNLVSIIGEATTSLSGLLSATDKSRLDALYALLGASDDADTVVNTINEVLAIFSQYPEGVTLTNALALKVAISDIVDNLTTQDATKPLSAKQGYVLKGLIDALIPVDNLTSTSTTAPLTAKQGKVLKDLIDDLERWYLALSGIAEDYDSTSTYSKGDVVANSGNLFRAKADITTPEQWTAAHWESVTVVELINEKLTRGDYDATTGVGYADNADQLNSPDFTTDQAPYLYRTSGGDADIGNREKDTIVGGSLGWNQLLQNPDFSTSSGWYVSNATISISSGIATITSSSDGNGEAYKTISGKAIVGHKYLVIARIKTPGDIIGLRVDQDNWANSFGVNVAATPNQWAVYSAIITPTASSATQNNFHIYPFHNTTAGAEVEIDYANIIDLTAMFGATIADYIYSIETATAGAGVAWFKRYFPKPYYPYKAIGGFLHVKLTSHDMVGFNQWDEEVELGALNGNTGGNYPSSNSLRSKNYISVFPSTTYYGKIPTGSFNVYQYDADKNFLFGYNVSGVQNGTFTTNAKTHFIRLEINSTYGTTYNHDININLSWSGWRNGQYEAHKKFTYPLDTSVILRGIPKLDADNNLYYDGDKYHSDGTVEEEWGIIDLSTIPDWVYDSTYSRWYTDHLAGLMAPTADNNTKGELFSPLYENVPVNFLLGSTGNYISGSNGSRLSVKNGSSTTEPSGYLIYRKKTATTSSATPYQETQEVDDFGTEEYVVPEQDGVKVPVGHYTEYPENLRDKLRRLPNMPTVSESTTATYAVNYNGQTKKCSFVPINDWLAANGYSAVEDVSSSVTLETGITATLKKAYKQGNVMTMSLVLQNTSGAELPAYSTLFTLASGLFPTNQYIVAYVEANNLLKRFRINPNGQGGIEYALPNNGVVYINISYAVA